MKLSPQKVESLLQATAVDIGLPGYDECFGNGWVDALRAVTGDTSNWWSVRVGTIMSSIDD